MALLTTPSALASALCQSSPGSCGHKGLLCAWTVPPSLAQLPTHAPALQVIPLLTNQIDKGIKID